MKTAGILAFYLCLWQIAALVVHNPILFVGPKETAMSLFIMVKTSEFWFSIGNTFLRIGGGFLTGTVLAVLAAVIAYYSAVVGDFLEALVAVQKTIPVASFVILFLIWAGNRNLAFFIVWIVVFPVVYLNLTEGLNSMDAKMLEMAKVFRIGWRRRVRAIVFPEIRPFFLAAMKNAWGMSWKSGVAAEVIGQPLLTIGNGLYRAKINLDTGRIFAWTIVIVLLSLCIEKGILFLVEKWR